MDARNDFAPPTGFVRQGRSWSRLVRLALVIFVSAVGPTRAQEAPRRDGPTAIILEPPASRAALLDKLRRPDLWIWDGDAAGFERWLAARRTAPGEVAPPSAAVVGEVRVRVEADRDRGTARVGVALRVTLANDGPCDVPIALNGLILGLVTEAGRDLAVAAVANPPGWAVRLEGRGEHFVEVATTAPLRPVVSSTAIDLAIPPAATTEVELVAARPLLEARAGTGEPLVIDGSATPTRASGHLSPRSRLEVTWRERDPAGSAAPAALAARGELVVLVGSGAVETRAVWSVVAYRGSAREVVVQLPPDEEVIELTVDRRPVPIQRRPAPGARLDELVVPLAEPITAAGVGADPRPATIAFTTRRPRPPDRSGDSNLVALGGHPIVGAPAQTGVIGVARSDDWLITPVEGRGVRRVDPRADLPDSFRGRPEGWLGFEFAEQPFDLGLRVEATVPRFEVNARSTLVPDADGAVVSTTLLGRVWQGRLFEVRVLVPPGLSFEPAPPLPGGPTLRAERKRPRAPDPAASSASASASTSAEVVIATFAHPLGPGESFAVPLRGVWRVKADGPGVVGLFQPMGAVPSTTEVALVANPTRQFDFREGDSPHFIRLDAAVPVADWPWPAGFDARLGAAATWVRSAGAEPVIPVRVRSCPRTIQHRTALTATVDRTGADLVTELTGEVTHGTVGALEIALPPDIPDRWVAEAGEGLVREPLDPDPATGWRRYRLKLAEPTDTFQIRLRHRQEFAPGGTTAGGSDPCHLRLEPIRLLDGIAASQTVQLAAATDVALQVQAPGWTDRGPGPSPRPESPHEVQRTLEHQGAATPAPIDVAVTLGTLANLPTLVASRVWIRSTQLPAGRLVTTAQYRLEAHARAVVIRLPAGSKWVRGVAGTVELVVTDVELIAPETYRITLPAALGPVPLRIDSILDEPPGDGSWPAPELVGGAVQQTVWELNLLGTRAGVGIPAGWADENLWYRVGLLWRRRPSRGERDLARWLADGALPPDDAARAAPDGGPAAIELASGRHSYLFSRPGPPAPLVYPTYARSTLLLVCSGPILVFGLLILAWRPPPRWVAAVALGLGFLFVSLAEPNTAWLVAESSSVGFALTAIAAAIHWTLDRRSRAGGLPEPPVNPAPLSWDAMSVALPPPPSSPGQSAERTVLRSRPEPDQGSTGEYEFPIRPALDPPTEATS